MDDRALDADTAAASRAMGDREMAADEDFVTAPAEEEAKSFALITHCFSEITKQVDQGIRSVKLVSTFLKRLAQTKERAARQDLETIVSMLGKEGEMPRFAQALTATLDTFRRGADRELQFVRVLQELCASMDNFSKTMDHKRRIAADEERKITSEFQKDLAAVERSRRECIKIIEQLQACNEVKATPVPATASILSKFTSAVNSALQRPEDELRSRGHQLMLQHQLMIITVNKSKDEYYQHRLPELCQHMRDIEDSRLNFLQVSLGAVRTAFNTRIAPLEGESTQLAAVYELMNVRSDMNQFVDTMLERNGPAQALPDREYDLPYTPEQVKANNLDADRVFGQDLALVLQREQELGYKGLDGVPAVIFHTLAAIRTTGGLETEGIFRISCAQDEMTALKEQLEAKDFDIKCSSPHIPAAVLKLWLRELPEPVISQDVFNEAVALAKLATVDTLRILHVYQKLPPMNQRLLEELARFFVSIVKHTEKNRMDIKNLAIVFAPSLMRNPSSDPIELLASNKFELRFVELMFKALAERIGG